MTILSARLWSNQHVFLNIIIAASVVLIVDPGVDVWQAVGAGAGEVQQKLLLLA